MTSDSVQRVGLIGWPVEHSVSPAMHNAAFEQLGLHWTYSLAPAPPEHLSETLEHLQSEGYRGANVTVPHKQAVMQLLDSVSEEAEAIGAVNTLTFSGGHLAGTNTDGEGFLCALRESGFEPNGRRALVLGAGGASRAVVYALTQEGCEVVIHNRSVDRAQRLARDVGAIASRASVRAMPSGARPADLDLGEIDLLVNATTVGMWPDIADCPWPVSMRIPEQWTVFDLVYNPPRTGLLALAQDSKARGIGGVAMLVHQGALAFELWTGCQAPVKVMRLAAEASLAGGHAPRP